MSQSPQARSTPPLTIATKLWFGIGQAAEGMKNYAFNAFLFFYYTFVLDLDPALSSLAMFIALLFDAVSDPLVGMLSDGFRHRWGRRHLFMYLAAAPMGITFYFCWDPPADLGPYGLFTWMLVWTVLARAAMTLYHVPHLALGADMSTDYAERTNITAWRTYFGVAGFALIAFGVPAVIFQLVPPPAGLEAQRHAPAYPVMGAVFGAMMTLLIFASALGTHSRIPYLVQGSGHEAKLSIRDTYAQLRSALENRSFLALFAGLLIFYFLRGIDGSLNLAMGTYFWKIGEAALYLAAVGGIAVLFGIPIWVLLARRLDKKLTFLIGLGGFGCVVALPPILKVVGLYPSQELYPGLYLGLLFASSAIAGLFVGAPLIMSGSMLADIADEHDLTVGRRQEGIFFGANSFSAKAAVGLGNFFAGQVLSLIQFPVEANVGAVPAEKILQLGVIYGPGSLLVTLLALGVLSRYSLTRERYAEIRSALEARPQVAS